MILLVVIAILAIIYYVHTNLDYLKQKYICKYCEILDEDIKTKKTTSPGEASKIADDLNKEGGEAIGSLVDTVSSNTRIPDLEINTNEIQTAITNIFKDFTTPVETMVSGYYHHYEPMISSPYDLSRDVGTLTRIVDLLSSDIKKRLTVIKTGLEKMDASLELSNGKMYINDKGTKKEIGDLKRLNGHISLENGIISAKSNNNQVIYPIDLKKLRGQITIKIENGKVYVNINGRSLIYDIKEFNDGLFIKNGLIKNKHKTILDLSKLHGDMSIKKGKFYNNIKI